MASRIRERVKEAHHSSPDVIVGKGGVSEGVLREIDSRLDAKEVVKVKLLKTAIEVEEEDRRELARRIAEAVNARIMGIRGRTIILYRPKRDKAKLKSPERSTSRRRVR